METSGWRRRFALVGKLFTLAVLSAAAAPVFAANKYVKPGGLTTQPCGSSAFLACRYLQDALAQASNGDDILVASGTYYPDKGTGITDNDRSATFRMKAGVDLFGGYDVTFNTRSYACSGGTNAGRPCEVAADCPGGTCSTGNVTILSGDIDATVDGGSCTADTDCGTGNYCVQGTCLKGSNSYHVVTYDTANASVVLDGFVIKYGMANGSGIDNQGAAVQIRGSDICLATTTSNRLQIKNCLIRHNYGSDHGAVNDHAATTLIDNCVFRNNRAEAEGAALVVDSGSAEVKNSMFESNLSSQGGAAWFKRRLCCPDGTTCPCPGCPSTATPTITNCIFNNNSGTNGGAVWASENTLNVSGSSFNGNGVLSTGTAGGALWLSNNTVTISGSTFDGNDAEKGGAIFALDNNLTIQTSTFKNNTAADDFGTGGGAIWNETNTALIRSSTFEGNTALEWGGGAIYNQDADSITIENSKFIRNVADLGGAIWNELGGSLSVNTSTFLENTAEAGLFGRGAAVYDTDESGSPTRFSLCTFIGNTATGTGGVIYQYGTDHEHVNCLFAGNSTSAIRPANYDADVVLVNSTIAYNSGGGIIFDVDGNAKSATLTNCLLWGNDDGDSVVECRDQIDCGQTNCSGSSCTCGYSCGGGLTVSATYSEIQLPRYDEVPVANVWPGTGNINKTPGFVRTDTPEDCDPSGSYQGWGNLQCVDGPCPTSGTLNCDDYGNFRLGSSSPCVDAGNNTTTPSLPTTDLDNKPRILNTTVDMGAYERGAPRNNRYISYVPPSPGVKVAIRVTLKASSKFPDKVGSQWWAQTPFNVTDGGTTLKVVRLECNPKFLDYYTYGTLYIADDEIVPDAVYEIESVKINPGPCDTAAYISKTADSTIRPWGDVVGPWNGSAWTDPDGFVNQNDIDAVTDKVMGETFAPPLARCDVDPNIPNNAANASDIAKISDAKNGSSYPYAGPVSCSCTGSCTPGPSCPGNCCVYGRCCAVGSCTNTTQADCSGTWTSGAFCESSTCGSE